MGCRLRPAAHFIWSCIMPSRVLISECSGLRFTANLPGCETLFVERIRVAASADVVT